MYNPKLTWLASPSTNTTNYLVKWTLNGAAAGNLQVQRDGSLDGAGYSTTFAAANPTVVLKGHDVVGASVTALDVPDNLSSAAVPASPATVTVPNDPPQPPVNVTLSLS